MPRPQNRPFCHNSLPLLSAGVDQVAFSPHPTDLGETICCREQTQVGQAARRNQVQVVTHGFWPQISPMFISYTLSHFEVNVRSATVLGLVGAGGIGFYLQQTMRSFSFQEAGVVVLIILGSVFVIDKVSAKVREWLI